VTVVILSVPFGWKILLGADRTVLQGAGLGEQEKAFRSPHGKVAVAILGDINLLDPKDVPHLGSRPVVTNPGAWLRDALAQGLGRAARGDVGAFADDLARRAQSALSVQSPQISRASSAGCFIVAGFDSSGPVTVEVSVDWTRHSTSRLQVVPSTKNQITPPLAMCWSPGNATRGYRPVPGTPSDVKIEVVRVARRTGWPGTSGKPLRVIDVTVREMQQT